MSIMHVPCAPPPQRRVMSAPPVMYDLRPGNVQPIPLAPPPKGRMMSSPPKPLDRGPFHQHARIVKQPPDFVIIGRATTFIVAYMNAHKAGASHIAESVSSAP